MKVFEKHELPAHLRSGACMSLRSPAGSLSLPCPPPPSAAAAPASLAAPAAAPQGSAAAARRAALCFQRLPAALQAHSPDRRSRPPAPHTGIAASQPAPVPQQGSCQMSPSLLDAASVCNAQSLTKNAAVELKWAHMHSLLTPAQPAFCCLQSSWAFDTGQQNLCNPGSRLRLFMPGIKARNCLEKSPHLIAKRQ